MATNTELVQQLYVAYYNRPADVDGLAFYVKALDSGATVAEIAKNFATGPEYVATFAGMQADEIIDTIYVNLFGRHADKTGLNFWGNELTSGISPLDVIVRNIAAGALNADGTLNADGKVYANKVAAAVAFTTEIDTVGNEQERVAYASGHVNGLAKTFLAGITTDASLTAALATIHTTGVALVDAYTPVTVSTLTTAVDTLIGGSGNDVFNGTISHTAVATDTLNALDSIDGGAGNDTLNIANVKSNLDTTDLAGILVKNVETISIRSVGDATIDLTSDANITGVTNLAVTQAANAQLTAAATTNIAFSGVSGTVVADGGLNETVTTSAGQNVTLGYTTGAAGIISVTDTKQAATTIEVHGGSDVSVTSSGSTGGAISVGGAGPQLVASTVANATGTVLVNSTGAAASGSAATSTATVTVTGGTSITVNQVATSDASAAATDTAAKTTHGVTQGAVTVTGDKHTTSVTVTQTAAAAGKDAVVAVAGSYQTDVQTFKDLASGKEVTVDGLTFTAAKDLTAAEVAAAFANIAASGVQGTGVVGNGTYTGALSANFASGAASGATVTFTAVAKAAPIAFTVSTDGTALTAATETGGAAATAGVTGVLKVVDGAVAVSDSGDKVLTTVTLDAFGASSSVSSDALTTLNLANSNKDVTIGNAGATNTTLALNLNHVGTATAGATVTDTNNLYTTLNVTTATADSVVAVAATSVATLNVSGTNAVDLTGSSFALKTVTVTGAAGVTVDASAGTVTAVDTSGTTGDSTVKLDGTKATFTGGAGVDTVTLTTVAPAKAIALGAGDDVLYLKVGTTSIASTGSLAGGDGTDVIVFADAADADSTAGATLDGAFGNKISGFETVGFQTFSTDVTVNMHNLDDISSIMVGGSTAAKTLTLDKMVANSTIEFDGAMFAGSGVVAKLADATGSADVLNVVTNVADVATDFKTLTAAGVETINLTATDSNDDADATTIATHTIDLVATSAKSIVVTGNANVVLVADAANVKLASLDASALTGTLTAQTNGTLAETITGGAGNDHLTAVGTNDVLNGGAGNDTLIAGNLTKMTGGAGVDTFDVSVATNNVTSFATISDLSAGDVIQFSDIGTESFKASKVVLDSVAVFQDYANAAIKATAAGDVSWFQIGGNTYVVENIAHGTSFTNGTDIIVKLTGAVDLSHASFSADAGTLVFVA
jgi:S-layer protein